MIFLIDKEDPISEVANIIKIGSKFEVSPTRQVISEALESDQIKDSFSIEKWANAVFELLEDYQHKYKSYLPVISVDDIQKILDEYWETIKTSIPKLYKATEGLRKYPEHCISLGAYRSAAYGNKEDFYAFLTDDLGISKIYLSYVWEVLDKIFHNYSTSQFLNIKRPFRYIKVSAKRAYYKTDSKFKKDPFIKKLEKKLNKNRDEILEPLFIQVFPITPEADDISLNSFEDLKNLENIIALKQASHSVKNISDNRLTEITEFLIARYVFNVSRKEIDKLLGWPQGTGQRIWRYYNLHKESFQKIIEF
ncbi:MAG: hypothetical protein JSV31_16345 [Desulfobacterales bacterium]|nr:MAG: hypothetical protein JSV31_16345 [Desulfobacterales bacterium]